MGGEGEGGEVSPLAAARRGVIVVPSPPANPRA